MSPQEEAPARPLRIKKTGEAAKDGIRKKRASRGKENRIDDRKRAEALTILALLSLTAGCNPGKKDSPSDARFHDPKALTTPEAPAGIGRERSDMRIDIEGSGEVKKRGNQKIGIAEAILQAQFFPDDEGMLRTGLGLNGSYRNEAGGFPFNQDQATGRINLVLGTRPEFSRSFAGTLQLGAGSGFRSFQGDSTLMVGGGRIDLALRNLDLAHGLALIAGAEGHMSHQGGGIMAEVSGEVRAGLRIFNALETTGTPFRLDILGVLRAAGLGDKKGGGESDVEQKRQGIGGRMELGIGRWRIFAEVLDESTTTKTDSPDGKSIHRDKQHGSARAGLGFYF